MQERVNVSAWGIRHDLGPISLPVRDETGAITLVQVTDGQANVPLSAVPGHLAHSFGVRGMEIPDWFLVRASAAEQEGFRQALIEHGVSLDNVTIDGRSVGDANTLYREDDLAEIERMIALAAHLGARAARVNLLPPPIVPHNEAASFDEIVASLRRLVAFAGALGLRLLIENHCDLTDTAEKVDTLLDAVGPELGFILDTGNIEPIQSEILAGFREQRAPHYVADAETAYRLIEALLPRAALVHIKTYGYEPDGKPMVYDVDRVVSTVVKSGYKGSITIECASFQPELVYDAIDRTVAKLKTALA